MNYGSTAQAYEETRRSPSPAWRLLYLPAVADWTLASFMAAVIIGLVRAPASPARNHYLGVSFIVLALFLSGVYAFRLRFERRSPGPGYLTVLAYHVLPIFCTLALYFNLRPILPIVNPTSYDADLYQLDLQLFGTEPTLALERFASPGVVEWFSFFYYSYFFFIASFIFVMIVTVADERRLAHFATGLLLVVAIGHITYMLVPGLGPYAHLAHDYQGPLRGGPFYHLVLNAVSAGGPLRDIFPSLHTALPSYCTLFAWRHYRRVAPIATFFCLNIMCATIMLRWHYAIDVIAGLVLATTAFLITPRLVESYQSRREALGLGALRRW